MIDMRILVQSDKTTFRIIFIPRGCYGLSLLELVASAESVYLGELGNPELKLAMFKVYFLVKVYL